jgi:hypothetical protein
MRYGRLVKEGEVGYVGAGAVTGTAGTAQLESVKVVDPAEQHNGLIAGSKGSSNGSALQHKGLLHSAPTSDDRFSQLVSDMISDSTGAASASIPNGIANSSGGDVECVNRNPFPLGPEVLSDVSFSVRAGEKIGIVGRTGVNTTLSLVSWPFLRPLSCRRGQVVAHDRPLPHRGAVRRQHHHRRR